MIKTFARFLYICKCHFVRLSASSNIQIANYFIVPRLLSSFPIVKSSFSPIFMSGLPIRKLFMFTWPAASHRTTLPCHEHHCWKICCYFILHYVCTRKRQTSFDSSHIFFWNTRNTTCNFPFFTLAMYSRLEQLRLLSVQSRQQKSHFFLLPTNRNVLTVEIFRANKMIQRKLFVMSGCSL